MRISLVTARKSTQSFTECQILVLIDKNVKDVTASQKRENSFIDTLRSCIHLEEYHEPGFLHFQQVYSVYCNLLSTHLKHWRLRGRESKQPGYIFCSIVIVSLSNTAWPLIYLKMTSWELTQGHPEQRSKYCLEISITWGRLKFSRWPFH